MHAGIMKRQPTVDISSVDSDALGQTKFQYKRVAVDGRLMQTVPLIDIVLGPDIHKARIP